MDNELDATIPNKGGFVRGLNAGSTGRSHVLKINQFGFGPARVPFDMRERLLFPTGENKETPLTNELTTDQPTGRRWEV